MVLVFKYFLNLFVSVRTRVNSGIINSPLQDSGLHFRLLIHSRRKIRLVCSLWNEKSAVHICRWKEDVFPHKENLTLFPNLDNPTKIRSQACQKYTTFLSLL